MEYHKTQLPFTERAEYRKLPLAIKGAHGVLLHYCARKENSGVIIGCFTWSERDWSAETNFQLKKKDAASVVAAGLAEWKKDDLHIHGYDLIGEAECQKNRKKVKAWREGRTSSATGTDTGSVTGNDVEMLPVTLPDPYHTSPYHTRPGGLHPPSKTPPLDFSQAQKTDPNRWLRDELADLKLPNHAGAIADWIKYFKDDLGATKLGECRAFLKWIVSFARTQGLPMEYPRHAGAAAARDWRENQRALLYQPKQAVAQ